jgi:hypothetical protein
MARAIDHRFQQEPAPVLFLLGDLNDGPGKEFFERPFLFFDLLNNVQGDVRIHPVGGEIL